jgi:hypothetical protein
MGRWLGHNMVIPDPYTPGYVHRSKLPYLSLLQLPEASSLIPGNGR